jgi:flavin reductase (DIM6/NTAB) family NADH-FMN oxidoreductase RutF/pimeloyl-ACP methyl ester carboxylesterase
MGNKWIIQGYGGANLAAESWGNPENPTVVLVHGLGQSRGVWAYAARALAEAGRYAISFDLRGHGESDRPSDGKYDFTSFVGDLRAVLEQLSNRPVVVGGSAGGWIAAAAVGEGGPQCASGLVLVDAAPWLDFAASQRIGDLLKLHVGGFRTVEDAQVAAAQLYRSRKLPSLEALRSRLILDSNGLLHWNWDARVLGALQLDEVARRVVAALPHTKIPTLCIRGRESEFVTAAAATQLQALIPGAESVEVEGAGHIVASDQVDSFNATLLEFLERRIPRDPLIYSSGSDSRTLRDALGCFATGITVVTTVGPDGAPVGLTANSFSSVSLNPPLILACLAKSTVSLAAVEHANHFAINVLHIGQQPLSERFSKRGEDRFITTPYSTWSTGVPIINGSLANFECRKYALYEGGDHMILVGQVERAQFEPRRDPLLYFRGVYRRLHFY